MGPNDSTNTLILADEAASIAFATRLGSCISPPLLMCFSGEIGAGKTTIIRAVLRQLGVESAIKSPTFTLVESYPLVDGQFHHFDLYRIQHDEELEYLGFRDFFTQESICCIEWAEKAGNALPAVDIRFTLSIEGAGRALHMHALSATGKHILACLAGE